MTCVCLIQYESRITCEYFYELFNFVVDVKMKLESKMHIYVSGINAPLVYGELSMHAHKHRHTLVSI